MGPLVESPKLSALISLAMYSLYNRSVSPGSHQYRISTHIRRCHAFFMLSPHIVASFHLQIQQYLQLPSFCSCFKFFSIYYTPHKGCPLPDKLLKPIYIVTAVVLAIFEQQSRRDKNRYKLRCCLRYPQSLCPHKQGQPEYSYCLNNKGAHERNNSRDFTIIESGEVSRGIDVKTLKDEGKRKDIQGVFR